MLEQAACDWCALDRLSVIETLERVWCRLRLNCCVRLLNVTVGEWEDETPPVLNECPHTVDMFTAREKEVQQIYELTCDNRYRRVRCCRDSKHRFSLQLSGC